MEYGIHVVQLGSILKTSRSSGLSKHTFTHQHVWKTTCILHEVNDLIQCYITLKLSRTCDDNDDDDKHDEGI